MRERLLVPCLLLALAVPRAATGEEAGPAEAVRLLLLRHEGPPPPEALARLVDDPVATLEGIARDRDEPTLVRRRAATMLGLFPGPRAEAALARLLEESDEGRVRRAAARALSRLLERRPAELLPRLAALLRSEDPDDREAAVWLLAEVDTDEARRLLSRQRVVERHRAVVDALRQVRRRSIR